MTTNGAAREGGAADAAVVFRCQSHLLAVATRWVERLLMREEVRAEEPAAGGGVARIWVDDLPWAAWDLGVMLGMGPLASAYVLLRVPWRAGTTRLALRTGPCLAVQRLPPTWPLRPEVFASRAGAVSAAFDASALGKPAEALMGYVLDPASLWTLAELELSASLTDAQVRPMTDRGP